jgi:hypothetical protein
MLQNEVETFARGTRRRYGYAWQNGYGHIGGNAVTPDGRTRAYFAVDNYGAAAEVTVRGVVIPGTVHVEDTVDTGDAFLRFTPDNADDWPRDGLEPLAPPAVPSPLYAELAEALGTKNAVSVDGFATCAVRIGETGIGIRYHSTIVVLLEADGTIILNNGGYYTKTSLERINRFTPPSITVTGMIEPHFSRSSNPRKYWTVLRDGEPIFDDFAEDFRGVVITTDRELARL